MKARDGKLWDATREDASEGQLFDELTRGLAGGAISRRRALKLAGAAILGSTGLLAMFPGVAGAQTIVGRTQPTVVPAGGARMGEPSTTEGVDPTRAATIRTASAPRP